MMEALLAYYITAELLSLLVYFTDSLGGCDYGSPAAMRTFIFLCIVSSIVSHRQYHESLRAHDAAILAGVSEENAPAVIAETTPLYMGGWGGWGRGGRR
jgi:hypothetical protein